MTFKDFILFGVVIALAAGAGLWVLEQQKRSNLGVASQEQAQSQEALENSDGLIERIPHGENLRDKELREQQAKAEQDFEIYLNALLDDLRENMRSYKSSRRTISTMINPANLRNPDYITENRILASDLIAKMQGQMEKIITTFESAEIRITEILDNHPNVNQRTILDKWRNVKNAQMNNYISFFELDGQYLDLHNKMLAFLDNSSKQFTVDVMSNQITFNDPAIERQYFTILSEIDEIVKQQSKSSSNQNSKSEELKQMRR